MLKWCFVVKCFEIRFLSGKNAVKPFLFSETNSFYKTYTFVRHWQQSNFQNEVVNYVVHNLYLGPIEWCVSSFHSILGTEFALFSTVQWLIFQIQSLFIWCLPHVPMFSQHPEPPSEMMSAKYSLVGYNSSRKPISISIPSSTEVMSPHIKSVEELKVLGINLSSFSAPMQFFICVAGVFIFYLIYGYLQVATKKKHHSINIEMFV